MERVVNLVQCQYLFTLIVVAVLTGFCVNTYAQRGGPDYIPTPNTVKDASPDPKKQGKKEKKILFIITNSTKNTLSGNACFEEATRKMGFQYLAIPKGQAPNATGWDRWLHNFGVKCIIFFKNGPLWKVKTNRLLKDCKYQTGDFVG